MIVLIFLVLLGVVILVLWRTARGLIRDTVRLDLAKPIGLFVLRLLIPAGVAVVLFWWAHHVEEEIAPRVQMAEIESAFSGPSQYSRASGSSDVSLKIDQTFITILRILAWLAVGVALVRLYHLYRRLEAGQITMTTVMQQLQSRVQAPVAAPVAPSAEDIEKRIAALRRMKDEGSISEAEYEAKRAELLNRM